jgi:1,4-alpha-glucan branching enzyme
LRRPALRRHPIPARRSEVFLLIPDKPKTTGFLTFTLHAHLPYVVNHGTWPHGMEWLHEAAAETYLPLLRVLGNLERDGIALHCNLNLSPILLEQLAHPVFQAEFPKYLERKIVSAREDEAFFASTGEAHYAETARFWNGFFSTALADFNALGGDIIRGFRHFNDAGLIDIITCGATHGYMPLLGTDESVRAQVRTAVNTHVRHIGKHPRGIWTPECGYRPAGFWNYPVPSADTAAPTPGFDRIGVEQALSESNIEFFFVDTHLVEESAPASSPYSALFANVEARKPVAAAAQNDRSLYHPHFVDGPYDKRHATTIFPRDPRTGVQVWSGDYGYPGDAAYLDFHKKRWPGGHRYWRVTGHRVDIGDKAAYEPQAAAERIQTHAEHFVSLVREALESSRDEAVPPILCSPFDAELFGHWWFEGPLWLEAVARILHDQPTGLELTSCANYLDRYPRAGFIAMHEGSWGAEGTNHVWMNPDTSWTYTHIYAAELFCREVCTAGAWREDPTAERLAKQLCRELLLLESSDWQFLITTGAARDYAELRFQTHNDQFHELKSAWLAFEANGSLSPEQDERLATIEIRDSIFADIDPGFWALGARDTRSTPGSSPAAEAAPARTTRTSSHSPSQVPDASLTQLPKFSPTA